VQFHLALSPPLKAVFLPFIPLSVLPFSYRTGFLSPGRRPPQHPPQRPGWRGFSSPPPRLPLTFFFLSLVPHRHVVAHAHPGTPFENPTRSQTSPAPPTLLKVPCPFSHIPLDSTGQRLPNSAGLRPRQPADRPMLSTPSFVFFFSRPDLKTCSLFPPSMTYPPDVAHADWNIMAEPFLRRAPFLFLSSFSNSLAFVMHVFQNCFLRRIPLLLLMVFLFELRVFPFFVFLWRTPGCLSVCGDLGAVQPSAMISVIQPLLLFFSYFLPQPLLVFDLIVRRFFLSFADFLFSLPHVSFLYSPPPSSPHLVYEFILSLALSKRLDITDLICFFGALWSIFQGDLVASPFFSLLSFYPPPCFHVPM